LDEVVPIRRRANRSRLALALAVLLTLAHLAWVPSSLFPVFPDFDASGYLTAATVIAERGEGRRPEESPLQFVGVHWFPAKTGGYVSRYPPGFPLLLAGLLSAGGMAGRCALDGDSSRLFPVPRQLTAYRRRCRCRIRPARDDYSAAMACLLGAVLVLDSWKWSSSGRLTGRSAMLVVSRRREPAGAAKEISSTRLRDAVGTRRRRREMLREHGGIRWAVRSRTVHAEPFHDDLHRRRSGR
jgi:hypothetical protein